MSLVTLLTLLTPIFCVCFGIVADIACHKINSIIANYEHQTRRVMTPEIGKWLTIVCVFSILATIAGCVFIFSVI